jgi:hypothetical protein
MVLGRSLELTNKPKEVATYVNAWNAADRFFSGESLKGIADDWQGHSV